MGCCWDHILSSSWISKLVRLALPYLTFGVGRLLHLPSAEAVSVRPNAQPRCNQKVTVIACEAETSAVKPKSAVKPNKSRATWDWWRVVWLFLSGGLRLVSSLSFRLKNRPGHRCISPTTTPRWQTSVGGQAREDADFFCANLCWGFWHIL